MTVCTHCSKEIKRVTKKCTVTSRGTFCPDCAHMAAVDPATESSTWIDPKKYVGRVVAADVGMGPYAVLEKVPGFFQIVLRSNPATVRSTGPDPVTLLERCAAFNRDCP